MELIILRMLINFVVSFIFIGHKPSYRCYVILCANVEAKINGKQLLNNIAALTSKFDFSFGFQMAIEERIEQVFM